VGVALGHLDRAVTQYPADFQQGYAFRDQPTGEGVPQVMDTKIRDSARLYAVENDRLIELSV